MKIMSSLFLIASLLIFAGCGNKKNKTETQSSSTSAAAPAPAPTATPAPTPSVLTFDLFKTKVAIGEFASKTGKTEIYTYGTYSASVSSSDCLWIFTCSKYSSKVGSFTREYSDGYVSHGFCTGSDTKCIATLKTKLAELVAQATYYQAYNATGFQFQTANGYVYLIDLSYPIVANPVARYDQYSASFYQYIGVTRF